MKVPPLCLLLFLLMPPTLRAQELKNPGFEAAGPALVTQSDAPNARAQISGVVADGWEDNTNWADVKIAYSLDPANPHGGKLSQKIAVTRGFAQFVQPVRFAPGRYRVSLWMRAELAQWVSLRLRLAAAPYTYYGTASAKVGPEWTNIAVEGVTPGVDGIVMVNTVGTGTVWLDDGTLARAGSAAQTLSPPKGVIPRAFFGLNVNHMHDPPGFDWPALDFGTYRTWDSGVVWDEVEPERGVYHWANLDKDVAQAGRRHIQFLFTLGVTPRWASSQPDAPAVYALGSGAPPARLDDWKDFLRAVAARYKGRIKAYEVWNEPDLNFYTGTPAQLVPLEKAAAEVIHQADPNALVLAPAPSNGSGPETLKWYDDYLSAGGGRYADALALHSYSYPAESQMQDVGSFRALVKSYGLGGKPLWLTESGVNREGHTEAEASAYILREYVIDWALGLPRLCFYAYDNEIYFGLDQGSGRDHRRPALLDATGIAYRQTQDWLTGARMLSCGSDADGTWTCALRRPGGKRTWIVWNTGEGVRPFVAPASWKVKVRRDLTGAAAPILGRLTVSQSPILLEP